MSKRILVVDDDRGILNLVSMLLEEAGYQVDTAEDGCEALEVLARGLPDLIVLDLGMPEMDGCAFANEFHARYDSQVPIILLTSSPEARQRAKEIGAVDFIRKPFTIASLVGIVNENIGGSTDSVSEAS